MGSFPHHKGALHGKKGPCWVELGGECRFRTGLVCATGFASGGLGCVGWTWSALVSQPQNPSLRCILPFSVVYGVHIGKTLQLHERREAGRIFLTQIGRITRRTPPLPRRTSTCIQFNVNLGKDEVREDAPRAVANARRAESLVFLFNVGMGWIKKFPWQNARCANHLRAFLATCSARQAA